MNDTLIFFHLPRTCVTTIKDILAKQYPEGLTFENKTLINSDHNFNLGNTSEKDKYILIKDRVNFGIHEHIRIH